MSQSPNLLTAAYQRGRDQDWVAQARSNRRKWRRRTVVIGSISAAVIFVVMFILYGYPRESGLTDALGLTCGEYVHVGDPSEVEPPFEDWTAHQQALSAGPTVDDEQLISAVEVISQEMDVKPTLGQFGAGGITMREHSAAAVGHQLLIGHHNEYWTSTDRISLVDPATGTITWTAETIHPAPNHELADEGRQRVLYGVGATDSHLVLQTPTYQGDTDLVVAELGSSDEPECLRLKGGVNTQQILGDHQGRATAWSQVLNLNAGRTRENEMLIHHGLYEDASDHQLSAVDIVSEDVESAALALQIQSAEESMEIPAAAQEEFDEGFESLKPVGEDHLLLTWDLGAVILERR